MPLAAIEALLDPASDARVRDLWGALDAEGLPSQARHRGATNAPHLTLVCAPRIDDAHIELAAARFGRLLPIEVPMTGLAVLGDGKRQALALLCAVPAPVVAAVTDLARTVADPRSGAWVPHITLGRRLTASQVGRALEVLGEQRIQEERLTVDRVRHWDPLTRSVTALPWIGVTPTDGP